jgi:hypothetical protein
MAHPPKLRSTLLAPTRMNFYMHKEPPPEGGARIIIIIIIIIILFLFLITITITIIIIMTIIVVLQHAPPRDL